MGVNSPWLYRIPIKVTSTAPEVENPDPQIWERCQPAILRFLVELVREALWLFLCQNYSGKDTSKFLAAGVRSQVGMFERFACWGAAS